MLQHLSICDKIDSSMNTIPSRASPGVDSAICLRRRVPQAALLSTHDVDCRARTTQPMKSVCGHSFMGALKKKWFGLARRACSGT